jgi:putative zinc-binding metallo-peptidase
MPRAVPSTWPDLPDEELLQLRMSDLPLKLKGTVLETRVDQLKQELASRGLDFPLHFYLSDEWFTPDGQASMAVPFYLAHPRLERLEKAQMLAVEGGEHEWCMRILRHEAGHVIDNVYKLRLRKQRRRLFGSPAKPYPEFYTPRPYSKRYVLHLDPWYAQSHPDEDFAETFAVWLTPESNWKTRYAGWPAIRKLSYMDDLMQSLVSKPPLLTTCDEVDPLRRLHRTLRYHYKKKRGHYGVDHPAFYDRDLRKLFSDAPEHAAHLTAAQFLARHRQQVRKVVADWTGIYQYTIDRVLEDIIVRCRELKLRLATPEHEALQEFTVLLTVQVMNYLHSGRHRIAL